MSSLKNLYYFFEDRYYSLLDKLNSKIPVYKIIDPIDKVFPSFILFLLAIALIIFLLSWFFLLPLLLPPTPMEVKITVRVLDSSSQAPIVKERVDIRLLPPDANRQELTRKTDSNGEFSLQLLPGTEVELTFSIPGFKEKTEKFTAGREAKTVVVLLERSAAPPIPPGVTFAQREISFVKGYSSSLANDDALYVSFNCEIATPPNNVEIVSPPSTANSATIYSGKAKIKYPIDCSSDLTVSVTSTKYEPLTDAPLTSETVRLLEADSPYNGSDSGTIIVQVYDSNTSMAVAKSMDIYVFEESDPETESHYTTTDSSGWASFDNPTGYYFVKAVDPDAANPDYNTGVSGVSEVLPNTPTNFDVWVSPSNSPPVECDENGNCRVITCDDCNCSELVEGNGFLITGPFTIGPNPAEENGSSTIGPDSTQPSGCVGVCVDTNNCTEEIEYYYISISVKDYFTKQPINADRIELFSRPDHNSVSIAEDTSFAIFTVDAETTYTVQVMKEGYLPYDDREILMKGDDKNIFLKPIIPGEFAGTANVAVRNEDNTTAGGATVRLYYGEGEGERSNTRAPYEAVTTDYLEGKATIEGIYPEHRYFARARSYYQEGDSETKLMPVAASIDYSIRMREKTGAVRFNVFDVDFHTPIEDFDARFFNPLTKEEITDYGYNEPSQTYSFPAKSTVYAIISAPGYNSVATDPVSIIRGLTINLNVPMSTVGLLESGTSMHFIELLDVSGRPVSDYTVELGKEYKARFLYTADELVAPLAGQAQVRVGADAGTSASDPLFITRSGSAVANRKLHSTSFSGEYSRENLSADTIRGKVAENSPSKWVNFYFDSFPEEAYSSIVYVFFRVRENATDLENLKLHFKSLAYGEGGSFIGFDPLDAEIISLPPDAYIYANAHELPLSLKCNTQQGDSSHCFADSITLLGSTLPQNDSCEFLDANSYHVVQLECEYNWFSTLRNKAQSIPELRVSISNKSASEMPSTALAFSDYSFRTPSNELEGVVSSAPFNSVPQFSSALNYGQLLESSADFTAADFGKVNDKPSLWINTAPAVGTFTGFHRPLKVKGRAHFLIAADPIEAEPFIDFNVELTVKNIFNEPVEGALVYYYIKRVPTPDKPTNPQERRNSNPFITNSSGEASFSVEPLSPGWQLWIEAVDRQTSDSAFHLIPVRDGNIANIGIEPGGLSFEIWFDDGEEHSTEITISNPFTNVQEKLKNLDVIITLTGSEKYFELSEMSSSFQGFDDTEIAPGESESIEFTVLLDTAETEKLLSGRTISGELSLSIGLGNGVETKALPRLPFTVRILKESIPSIKVIDEQNTQLNTKNQLTFDSNLNFKIFNASEARKQRTLGIAAFPVEGAGDFNNFESLTIKEFSFSTPENFPELDLTAAALALQPLLLREIPLNPSNNAGYLSLPLNAILSASGGTLPQDTTKTPTLSITLEASFAAHGNRDVRTQEFVLTLPFEVQIITGLFELIPAMPTLGYDLDAGEIEKTLSFSIKNISSTPLEISSLELSVDQILDARYFGNMPWRHTTPISLAPGQDHNFNQPITLKTDAQGRTVVSTDPNALPSYSALLTVSPSSGGVALLPKDFTVRFNFLKASACASGATAKPKVALNWSITAFGVDSENKTICDASRTDAVFCDSVQFLNSLFQKLHKFKENGGRIETNITEFQALLMNDGFSIDLLKDYADYAKDNFYAGLPELGVNGEFYEYLNAPQNNKFIFKVNGQLVTTNASQILQAGLHRVKVSFSSDSARSNFILSGSSRFGEGEYMVIDINYLNQTPKEIFLSDSAFYYTPFDGEIGFGTPNDRNGYGYSMPFAADIALTDTVSLSRAIYATGFTIINATTEERVQFLNSPQNRYRLFTLSPAENPRQKNLTYSASVATPLLLSAQLQRFDVPYAPLYYYLASGGSVLPVNGSLTEWKGVGSSECVDFSGRPVSGTPYPDERASEEYDSDFIADPSNYYKVAWSSNGNMRPGTTSLKTVLFTPVTTGTTFGITFIGGGGLITPSVNGGINAADLNGVQGKPFNNPNNNETIQSVADMLSLVEQGYACIENTEEQSGNTSTSIRWNAEKVFESIQQYIDLASTNCIPASGTYCGDGTVQSLNSQQIVEQCDPPGSGCGVGGTCSSQCQCIGRRENIALYPRYGGTITAGSELADHPKEGAFDGQRGLEDSAQNSWAAANATTLPGNAWITREWPRGYFIDRIGFQLRNNPSLPSCTQPKVVKVSFGVPGIPEDSTNVFTLTDGSIGNVQYFPVEPPKEATLITVSVLGTGGDYSSCPVKNPGFSEIEVYALSDRGGACSIDEDCMPTDHCENGECVAGWGTCGDRVVQTPNRSGTEEQCETNTACSGEQTGYDCILSTCRCSPPQPSGTCGDGVINPLNLNNVVEICDKNGDVGCYGAGLCSDDCLRCETRENIGRLGKLWDHRFGGSAEASSVYRNSTNASKAFDGLKDPETGWVSGSGNVLRAYIVRRWPKWALIDKIGIQKRYTERVCASPKVVEIRFADNSIETLTLADNNFSTVQYFRLAQQHRSHYVAITVLETETPYNPTTCGWQLPTLWFPAFTGFTEVEILGEMTTGDAPSPPSPPPGGDGGTQCVPACSAPTPYCSNGVCVECRNSNDCGGGGVCRAGRCTERDVWGR